MDGSVKWLQARGQLQANPLAGVGRVEHRGRQTFGRRVLAVEQFERLLTVAGSRHVVYMAAVLTGLRRGVLCGLRWIGVELDGDRPQIVLPAALAKNRTAHTIPLREDLVQAWRAIRPEPAT